MSDLQIILIILGAFIIAGVLVYNWLQEKKLHKQVSNDFIVPQKDVLVEDFYIDTDAFVEKELAEVVHKETFNKTASHQSPEHTHHDSAYGSVKKSFTPTPSAASETVNYEEVVFKNKVLEDTVLKDSTFKKAGFNQKSTYESNDGALDKDVLEDISATTSFEEASSTLSKPSFSSARPVEKLPAESVQTVFDDTPPQLPSEVHPQIDLTAVLYANHNISYQALYDMALTIEDISLPLMIFGLDDGDKWHQVSTTDALHVDVGGLMFKQATCSLQLADRGGPVAKNILNKFQFAVENMGLDLNAHVEWQGSGDVLQRAIEIDQFCIEVDQLINIHIAQNETPIHGTKFRGLAEASGMGLSDDGKFYYYDQSTHKFPLFSAIEANNQAFTAEGLRNSVLKAITFQLEIPKVPNCEQAFNQMILIAQKLSSSLSANLVDDNQKPLGDLQIEKIRQQLKVIHATMVARGVMPGSPASMRLFN